jgi:hypothetical protein
MARTGAVDEVSMNRMAFTDTGLLAANFAAWMHAGQAILQMFA